MIFKTTKPTLMNCHRKNGPGKNGLARPILDEKMVRPDHSWLTKNGPARPILVTKSGPPWPKMVQGQEFSTGGFTMGIVVFSSSSLVCSCFTRMNWHLHSTDSLAVARALKFRLNKINVLVEFKTELHTCACVYSFNTYSYVRSYMH